MREIRASRVIFTPLSKTGGPTEPP